VLTKYGFGNNGEYVGLDVKAMRTQPLEDSYRHLSNSMKIVELLEDKVVSFNETELNNLIEEGNYEKIEMMVVSHLLGV
jgi:xylose isomerase